MLRARLTLFTLGVLLGALTVGAEALPLLGLSGLLHWGSAVTPRCALATAMPTACAGATAPGRAVGS